MKQKDLAILIVVAFISGIASFFLSGSVFTTPKDRSQEVETIDKISSEFPYPSKKYFNQNSVNPAQLVEIEGNNPNPFQTQ